MDVTMDVILTYKYDLELLQIECAKHRSVYSGGLSRSCDR